MNFVQNHRAYFNWCWTILLTVIALSVSLPNGFAQTQPTAFTNFAPLDLPPADSNHIHVHDPSTIVKCGNEFWVFYTGRGIPSYHS